MAETLVNKTQAGEGIWHQDNLVAGSGISISQVPQPVIDENTLGVWHFENNLDNAVSGSSYTIATSSQGGLGFNYSTEKKKFGEYSATITGSTTGYYFFPASTPLNSFDNFTIDFWVQTGPSNWGSNYYQRYYIPGTSANQSCVKVEVSSSQIQVLAWTGASQVIKSCVPSTWVHIAIELYQSKLNVYLNGEKISSSDVGYSPLTFAVNPMGLSLQFDELRLSNVARYQGNNFTPYTVPYSASAGPAQYAINNTKADPDLTTKADTDLANVGATGKAAAISWMMPDYTADVSLGEPTTYQTLPCDCYVYYDADTGSSVGSQGFYYANSDESYEGVFRQALTYNRTGLGMFFPKGWKVKRLDSSSTIHYVPLKGVLNA